MTKVWNDMHERVEESCRKSIQDLQCDYIDLFFIHWPFPNYHAPGCDVDSRNPDSRPFSVEEFMNTYRQCEELVRKGLIRHIGISNMTIPKMEAVLPLMEIMPSACESEMHVCFQQKEIFDYLTEHKIQPIGFMPLGSPQRPERDMCPEDVADLQTPEMQEIAKAHGCHPALIALKWAHQRGQIPIPFSVHEAEYVSNLKAMTEDPLTEEEMQKIFEKIELKVDPVNHIVTIPTFRPDLEAQADLAEEIARFYGYNKIEATLASGTPTVGKRTYAQSITALVKDTVIANGLCEAMTYSFESPKVFDKLLIPADSDLRKAIVISNPLGEDFSIMRTVSFNGILTSLATNYNRRNESAGLFEVAKVYIPKALPLTELPHEIPTLTMGMYGNMDFYDLKGIVEHLMHVLGMSKVAEYVTEKALPWMHPGRTASVIVNGESIGYLGEVHPAVLKNYGIGTRAYLAVLDMEKVIANANRDVVYQALPKFPALTRDIAMLVKEDVTVKEIADIIKKNGGAYLEEAKLFDVYQGAQIEAGYKSVAYSITFRSAEKTLADADIADAMDKILKGLAEELGAQLRDK